MSCKKWLWTVALLAGVVCACQCDGVRGVAVSCETPEVWHQPKGKEPTEVIQDTQARKGDQVWTKEGGEAILKWPDLWLRLYDDTQLHCKEIDPTDLQIELDFGTGTGSGTAPWTWTTDHARIEVTGTTVMVSYHPSSRLTVVRVFDGQAEVRNLTGDVQESKRVSADEWAYVEPGKPPQVSDKLEEMRDLARELGLWDVFHEVELDVRDGFGPDESQVSPTLVEIVFVTPTRTRTPTVTPTPTYTATPTNTPTPTPSPTPTQCQFPVDPELSAVWQRDTFGCAHSEAKTIWAAWQSFEKGYMLWRSDTSEIITFCSGGACSGTWAKWPDLWREGTLVPSVATPQCDEEPLIIRGFGYLWGTEETVRDQLGCATGDEGGFCARIQDFETGLIFHSSTLESCPDGQGNQYETSEGFKERYKELFFSLEGLDSGTWSRRS